MPSAATEKGETMVNEIAEIIRELFILNSNLEDGDMIDGVEAVELDGNAVLLNVDGEEYEIVVSRKEEA